jgi:hypothetical protein
LILLPHLIARLTDRIRRVLQAIGSAILLLVKPRGDLLAGLAEHLAGFFLNLFSGRPYLLPDALLGLANAAAAFLARRAAPARCATRAR